MVAVTARALTKIFDDDNGAATTAVQGVDLDVASGEFVALLGPTGCGKSTLLRLIAGLDEPTEGSVYFDGVPVGSAGVPPVAMVTQVYALYPHLTVAQNIGFPLRVSSVPSDRIAEQVAETARHVGVADLLGRYPEHLSGGQRQRVALARALVRHPPVLLLDEPLSNVDAGSRAALRGEIVAVTRKLGVTTIYVTHDRAEAMGMADRVVLLRAGMVEQIGAPAEVYADPETVFVAAFLGAPFTALLAGAVQLTASGVLIDLGSRVLPLPSQVRLPTTYANARVTVGLRALSLFDGTHAASLTGTVVSTEHLGPEVVARVEVGAAPAYTGLDRPAPSAHIAVRVPGHAAPGSELTAGLDPGDLLLFNGDGNRIRFGETLDRIS
ncbi:ABC transporter ATP-binding protein [Actinoplanes sp. N902-109]|uniref:ABC transporter ATP-binding protein n=1 Tax=Actinoplanes sp. (strain N902-109) TaxID=649831 RepID=UPI00059FF3BD|nr:ABC transporter ATP-binding protein [Actinoplanes sp. N902-109]